MLHVLNLIHHLIVYQIEALFEATCRRRAAATILRFANVDNLCDRRRGSLEFTIPSHNRVSTEIGWKSVLLGTSTKSTQTGFC